MMALSVILNTFVMVFFVFNYLNWKLVLLILVNCWPSLFPLYFYNVIVCPFVLFILDIELSVFFFIYSFWIHLGYLQKTVQQYFCYTMAGSLIGASHDVWADMRRTVVRLSRFLHITLNIKKFNKGTSFLIIKCNV